jgi:hypothetical protein
MGSDNQPFAQSNWEPNEAITGETLKFADGTTQDVQGRSGSLGAATNSQGQFKDTPFGVCTSAALNGNSFVGAIFSGTQTITMVGSGGSYTVQTASFQDVIGGSGRGSVKFTMSGGFAPFIYQHIP